MARLQTALIGVGAWGKVLAKAAGQSQTIEFVACVGRNPERLSGFSRDAGIPARDIDAVLTDKTIQAVVLALPNEMHLEFAQRAAAARKHIYIEKPIANTMADALAIAALEQAHGVRIVVGHCARLLTGVRAIRAAIDGGKLGKVSQIEANFSNDRGLRITPQDWRWYSKSAPGGSLSQIGVHQFDTLRYLGGDIVAVSASAGRHSPVGAEVEDQWIVAVHFADGKLGTVISSWTSPGTFNLRATGADALMVYDIDQTHWANPESCTKTQHFTCRPAARARPSGRSCRCRPAICIATSSSSSPTAPPRTSHANCRRRTAARPWRPVYAVLKLAGEEKSCKVELSEIIDAARGADNWRRGPALAHDRWTAWGTRSKSRM